MYLAMDVCITEFPACSFFAEAHGEARHLLASSFYGEQHFTRRTFQKTARFVLFYHDVQHS
jgi:hypothetical protein